MTFKDIDEKLIDSAKSVINPRHLSQTVEVGQVGSALLTSSGVTHVGVCIDAACGVGFCAEHAAIASMATHGESRIHTIVAVDSKGNILSPCGRCRELISQFDPENGNTRILLPDGHVKTLRQLLPDHWQLNA